MVIKGFGFRTVENLFSIDFRFVSVNLVPYTMVLIIAILVFVWRRYYINNRSNRVYFHITLFLFVVSMLILVTRNRLLRIFLGWEGLGITSFLLIIFYQNWSRFQGGLLTLLTNRIGDGILILRFCYWVIQKYSLNLILEIRFYISILILILAFTKSAQAPFTRWLPAAIAAPTPVSALVHRSTLVTAGVWLIIKYRNIFQWTNCIWLLVGLLTLSLASIAALVETDGKKIVALSTLRQLGLMFIALTTGGYFICLFHLVAHAFAKANLFLVIGNLIHSRFSLQDIRFIGRGFQNRVLIVIIIIRVFSLSGIVFRAGFYSKDCVLIREFRTTNRIIINLTFLLVITLTFTYCLKLSSFILIRANTNQEQIARKRRLIPNASLRLLRIYRGFFFTKNINLVWVSKIRGYYWIYLFLLFIFTSLYQTKNWSFLFTSQIKIVKNFTFKVIKLRKTFSNKFSVRILERRYLNRFLFNKITLTKPRIILISIRVLILIIAT